MQVEGQRVKVLGKSRRRRRPAHTSGRDEREVIVKATSEQRRRHRSPKLYEETPESIARREQTAKARKAAGAMAPHATTGNTSVSVGDQKTF